MKWYRDVLVQIGARVDIDLFEVMWTAADNKTKLTGLLLNVLLRIKNTPHRLDLWLCVRLRH